MHSAVLFDAVRLRLYDLRLTNQLSFMILDCWGAQSTVCWDTDSGPLQWSSSAKQQGSLPGLPPACEPELRATAHTHAPSRAEVGFLEAQTKVPCNPLRNRRDAVSRDTHHTRLVTLLSGDSTEHAPRAHQALPHSRTLPGVPVFNSAHDQRLRVSEAAGIPRATDFDEHVVTGRS